MRRVGRTREKHRRMPKGWAPSRSGTIYFRPTNEGDREIVRTITGGALSLTLGANVDEAHASELWKRVVAARVKQTGFQPGFVSELVDRARRHYLTKKRIKNDETRAWRSRHLDELEREFGARRYAKNVYDATKAPAGTYLLAMNIQAHIDKHAETRHVAVNRAVQTWKIVWDEARRRWGLTEYNPCAGLDLNDEAPRDVLPDDRAHFFKVYRKLDPPSRFVLALGRYYGRRRGEALGIKLSGIAEDGVHTIRGKRAKELILLWDDLAIGRRPDGTVITRPGRLRKMVARAQRWRAQVIRPEKVWKNGKRRPAPKVVALEALLLNRRGRKLSATGFNTAFRRAMERVGLVEELGTAMVRGKEMRRTRRAFNPNDTRAKRASTLSKLQAVDVLAHDEERTTEVIYRRGPHVINTSELVEFPNGSRNSRKGSG